MTLGRSLLSLVLLAWGWPALGQGLPTATPESVGLSAERLERATSRLQVHIDAGDIAGVVGAVVRHGKLVYLEALGYQDLEARIPMREDALFRIYSMTRPITSLAAMMLWEEGRFALDDPVAKFLPRFGAQQVFVDADAPNIEQARARTGEMTVEHLLLHTSGLGSRTSSTYRAERVRVRSISVQQMVDNAARVPLFEDPGTRWRYGISTTILGRLVELWSGMPLDDFLRQRVFEPLGMTDTVFWVGPDRADRLDPVYRPSREGELSPIQLEEVPFTERPVLIEGGVGLVSTTIDYLRFSQMFLNKGELDGMRLLQSETVELMTVNRVPDALLPLGFGRARLGMGWSLGFSVVMDAGEFAYPMSDGEFWWDGSAGTRFWIDPAQDIITIVMAQVSPSGGNGFREEFKTLVYQAIVDAR